ncbi:hypothetical protein glysoja_046130 [Glycine soja]|uniref:Uncharacterized protein n=1 Tax=Glycine soja TaxID=3848 RepID=A0A0B2SV69_GLYSO|nr:hypothetical protein glysoja_046130 [Glycine soja]
MTQLDIHRDNLQCISQCSPTINHNNNPATSFQFRHSHRMPKPDA